MSPGNVNGWHDGRPFRKTRFDRSGRLSFRMRSGGDSRGDGRRGRPYSSVMMVMMLMVERVLVVKDREDEDRSQPDGAKLTHGACKGGRKVDKAAECPQRGGGRNEAGSVRDEARRVFDIKARVDVSGTWR